MYKKIFLTTFSLLLLLSLSTESKALGITPPLLDYSLEKGQTVTGEAEVFNNDDFMSNYLFKVVNIDYEGDTADPVFDINEDPSPDTLASWITVSPVTATVNSMSKVKVEFTITIPEDTEAGTYTAILVVMQQPSREAGSNEVGVGKQLGLTFVITVKGGNLQDPSLKDFRLVNGIDFFGIKILNTLPADFKTRLSNEGNTYFLPQGKIIIRNINRTKVIKNLELNPYENRVLPHKTRLYSNQFLYDSDSYQKYVNSKGESLIDRMINYLKYITKNFAIRRYNAELSVDARVAAENPVVFSEQINFIVFPYKAVGFISISILLLFSLKMIRGRKKLRGSRLR